ncbi:MAG TPA: MBL fold metallo-hydrolase [Gaiellaceae bacterium]
MREVAPGLWDWQAAHPEWQEGSAWGPEVSAHALLVGDGVVLFDPIDVPAELRARATAVVLTAPWHERDTRELGLPVYAPRPESAQDLIDLYDVDPARLEGFVSSDLRWLVHEGGGEWHEVSADEPPPFGIEAYAGRTPQDLVYYVESARAVISGDTLSDFGEGLEIRSEWLSAKVTREEVAARLRPLLERDVEVVLPAHGAPTGRAALERALD